jgi:heat shock protein HslJ
MKPQIGTLLLALAMAGCGAMPPGTGVESQLDGEWRMTGGVHGGDPLPLPADAPITLTIADGEASGRAACNHYSGAVTVEGDRLGIGAMSTTEMGCDPDVMEAESRYIAALADVAGWERSGNVLTLSGEAVELTYALVPPMEDAGLVDTLWTLDGLIDGEAVSSTVAGADSATLELRDDGSLSGTTGCRTFDGRYELDGATATVGDLVNDDRACPDVAGQDEHVLAVIGAGWSYEIAGNRLTLSAGDLGLTYIAAEG